MAPGRGQIADHRNSDSSPAACPVWEWLRKHDPGFSALRRAARAALIMPSALALGSQVIKNPVVATFAAFGSFAMMLLVDFAGSIRDRLRFQAALTLGCGVLISLGTLASTSTWLAAVVTAAVAFGGAVRRGRQLGAGGRHDRAAAVVRAPGVAPRPRLLDPGSPGRLGPGVGPVAAGDLAAVAGPGPRPGARGGDRRVPRGGGEAPLRC